MGLYPADCPQCKRTFLWFSGNSLDQVCQQCKNKEVPMDYEQAHLDSLNKVISVQNELIGYLKAEIERLKLSQLYIGSPNVTPGTPIDRTYPSNPNPSPWVQPYPGAPYAPQYPWYGPHPGLIITSDGTRPLDQSDLKFTSNIGSGVTAAIIGDSNNNCSTNIANNKNITLTTACVPEIATENYFEDKATQAARLELYSQDRDPFKDIYGINDRK